MEFNHKVTYNRANAYKLSPKNILLEKLQDELERIHFRLCRGEYVSSTSLYIGGSNFPQMHHPGTRKEILDILEANPKLFSRNKIELYIGSDYGSDPDIITILNLTELINLPPKCITPEGVDMSVLSNDELLEVVDNFERASNKMISKLVYPKNKVMTKIETKINESAIEDAYLDNNASPQFLALVIVFFLGALVSYYIIKVLM